MILRDSSVMYSIEMLDKKSLIFETNYKPQTFHKTSPSSLLEDVAKVYYDQKFLEYRGNDARNLGHKPFESFIQELASESMLKAPPPTPCLSLKQKSGSVPDVRIIDILQKDKSSLKSVPYRNVNHAISCHRKTILKSFLEYDEKRSSSDHSLASRTSKLSHLLALGQGPTTSHLLHSVRQKLLNL